MDIRKVKKLIELLEESNIGEIEIKEGEESVRISRQGTAPAPMAYAPAPAAPAAQPAPAAAPAAEAPAPESAAPAPAFDHLPPTALATRAACKSPLELLPLSVAAARRESLPAARMGVGAAASSCLSSASTPWVEA